jgi:hypothetical protein
MMNEHELPWLVDASGRCTGRRSIWWTYWLPVTVTTLLASKGPGLDCWITSDGLVYVAELQESSSKEASRSDLETYDGDESQVNTFIIS